MDFTGALDITPNQAFVDIVPTIGSILGISFVREKTGRFDEFPAYIAIVLGVEIAILGIPAEADLDKEDPVKNYSIIVQSDVEAPDNHIETDISTHLVAVLKLNNIDCM